MSSATFPGSTSQASGPTPPDPRSITAQFQPCSQTRQLVRSSVFHLIASSLALAAALLFFCDRPLWLVLPAFAVAAGLALLTPLLARLTATFEARFERQYGGPRSLDLEVATSPQSPRVRRAEQFLARVQASGLWWLD